MGLKRGLIGFGLGAGIFAGGIYSADRAFDAYRAAVTFEKCADSDAEFLPPECPDKLFVEGDQDTETGKAWLFGLMGAAGLLGGGVVMAAGVDEVYTPDKSPSQPPASREA